MARILIVSHYAKSLLNFRGELIKKMVELGHEVVALVPEDGFQEKLEALGADYLQIPLARTEITVIYRCQCRIEEMKQDYYERFRQKESTFVLIANLKDKQKWDDRGILQEYKNQVSIETKFPLLKSPVYLGPVYPEKPSRVQALAYVFILVLLIASYLEYRVRESLKKNKQYVLLPGRDVPIALSVFSKDNYGFKFYHGGHRETYFPSSCNKQALNMVMWAGYDPVEVYLKPLP